MKTLYVNNLGLEQYPDESAIEIMAVEGTTTVGELLKFFNNTDSFKRFSTTLQEHLHNS
jgi:hypothetical protein